MTVTLVLFTFTNQIQI